MSSIDTTDRMLHDQVSYNINITLYTRVLIVDANKNLLTSFIIIVVSFYDQWCVETIMENVIPSTFKTVGNPRRHYVMTLNIKTFNVKCNMWSKIGPNFWQLASSPCKGCNCAVFDWINLVYNCAIKLSRSLVRKAVAIDDPKLKVGVALL